MPDNRQEPVETGSLFEFLVKGQNCSMLALLLKLTESRKPQRDEPKTFTPTRN